MKEESITFEEEIIATASQMSHDAIIRTTWDLVFTNRRIIALKTGSGEDVIGGLLGVIGLAIVRGHSRKKSKKIQKLPISQILSSEYEKEFFPYEALESIIIRPSRIVSSKIVIKQRGKKKKRYAGNRQDVARVNDVSMNLRQYGAPIKQ